MWTRRCARLGIFLLALGGSLSGGCGTVVAGAAAGMLVARDGGPSSEAGVIDETAETVGDAAGQAVREAVRRMGERAINDSMPEWRTARRVYDAARAAKDAADAARRTPVYVPEPPRVARTPDPTPSAGPVLSRSSAEAAERIAAHARLMDEVRREIAAQRAALDRVP